MHTISLLDTEHTSYQHDGDIYIDQDAFDLSVERWMDQVGRDETDVASIYDGSSDVTYAYAWRNDENVVLVSIVQFNEEADGYWIGALPFLLDIAASTPEPEQPITTRLLVTIEHPASVPFTASDISASIWQAHEYRKDITISTRKTI